jgi:hypothetical protein
MTRRATRRVGQPEAVSGAHEAKKEPHNPVSTIAELGLDPKIVSSPIDAARALCDKPPCDPFM